MENRIFLVGLPGSGKTTLGRSLAEKLGYPFIDLDEEIVKREGKSISEFIQFQGQGNFRIKENELLIGLSVQKEKFVMATGGGTPCFHYNMDVMNKNGITIYLDVGPGDLALRIMDQGMEKRPLLNSYDQMDLIQEIRELKEERSPFYDHAKIKMSDNQINIDMIIAKLNGL
jgi:shikimate kinase